MEAWQVLVLGIIQGLTEFLPVSSSGHLVVFKQLLSSPDFLEEGPILEISLHLGTLLAILVYYRSDIADAAAFLIGRSRGQQEKRNSLNLLKWIFLGTIPTVLIGLAFKDWLEQCFSTPLLVGVMLLVTGLLCLITRFLPRGETQATELGVIRSLLIGLSQGLAIIPGISRSGATIVTAMCLGVRPREAGRFSFLLSLPAVAGAAVLKFLESPPPAQVSFPALGMGIAVSALVGFMCLGILSRILRAGNFFYFGFYCLPLGLAVILYYGFI